MTFQRFSPIEYLKIDIANNYGDNLDKANWDDRISWFNNHEDQLDTLKKKAENPALFFAGVEAYKKAVKGEPIGYPISLDGTASGIQILSCLMECYASASQCNVVDTGHRQDVYTNNYKAMCDAMGDRQRLSRAPVKDALMTAMYSSVAVPRETFGEGSELLACFYETVKRLLPGAWELNEAMLGTWRPMNKSHDWVLPDNFHVHVKVMNTRIKSIMFMNQPYDVRYAINEPSEEGRSNGANMTHSVDGMVVRELVARCMHRPEVLAKVRAALLHTGLSVQRESDQLVMRLWGLYQRSGFLSVRILNYLDSFNMGHVDPIIIEDMLNTFPKKPFKVLTVHDCFRVHPNYGNDLREQYNRILSDIARSNMLEFIVSQIVGYKVTVQKKGKIANDILQANYALS